jgi:hypothetical protein
MDNDWKVHFPIKKKERGGKGVLDNFLFRIVTVNKYIFSADVM